jgi:hypothetical protein
LKAIFWFVGVAWSRPRQQLKESFLGDTTMETKKNTLDATLRTLKVQPLPEKVVRSLAESVFETLCNEGCQPKDIIGVSSQLISIVTSELARGQE